MQFSANLGFLWAELPLPQAIHAAKNAGFQAVECHSPYNCSVQSVQQALAQTQLSMVGINTLRGGPKDFGLAAVPGREAEARAHIDLAIEYAEALGAANIHILAGKAQGEKAQNCFIEALAYACSKVKPEQTLLLEPLNAIDVPNYFMSKTEQALRIIDAVSSPKLKLMFDFYHVQISEGDVCRRFTKLLAHVGHVQIAAVPDRGAPDHGELNYAYVLQHIGDSGYQGYIGAEYRPNGDTDASLGWLKKYQGQNI